MRFLYLFCAFFAIQSATLFAQTGSAQLATLVIQSGNVQLAAPFAKTGNAQSATLVAQSGSAQSAALAAQSGNAQSAAFFTQSGSAQSATLVAQTDDTQPKPTRIAIISDLNGPYGTLDYYWHVDSTVARIARMQPDIVIVAGDMIAGQDRRLPDDRFAQMWDVFEKRVAAPLRDAGVPFGFTIGNHDGSPFDAFNRERTAARDYWNIPQTLLDIVDAGDFPFYFSYRVNDIFIISWDASSAEISEPTLNWVEQQLQTDEAREARYRIMLGHLPLYAAAIGRNRHGEILRDPDELHAIMQRYNVDMYVSGHHHAYYPGYKGGVELLQTGALGGGPRPLLGFGASPRKTWSLLEVPASADTPVTITTWDADTDQIVQNNELPRYLHGLTGFTIRRDNPPTTRMASGWLSETAQPYAILPNDGVEARIEQDTLHLRVRVPSIFAGSTIDWRFHTTIAESEVSDTLFTGRTLVPEVEAMIYPPFPHFCYAIPLAQLDVDGIRGGIYYLTVRGEVHGEKHEARARLTPDPNMPPAAVAMESIHLTELDNANEDAAASRAVDSSMGVSPAVGANGNDTASRDVAPASDNPAASGNTAANADDQKTGVDSYRDKERTVKLNWGRAIDPDGDGVYYTVRVTGGPGSRDIINTQIVGPHTEATVSIPSSRRSWYVEIIPNDQSLHGPSTGVWVSPAGQ